MLLLLVFCFCVCMCVYTPVNFLASFIFIIYFRNIFVSHLTPSLLHDYVSLDGVCIYFTVLGCHKRIFNQFSLQYQLIPLNLQNLILQSLIQTDIYRAQDHPMWNLLVTRNPVEITNKQRIFLLIQFEPISTILNLKYSSVSFIYDYIITLTMSFARHSNIYLVTAFHTHIHTIYQNIPFWSPISRDVFFFLPSSVFLLHIFVYTSTHTHTTNKHNSYDVSLFYFFFLKKNSNMG